VARARAAGLGNLSIDLIFGLPAHVGRSWADDLARVLDLDVPHVSLYGLTVESGTPLGRAVSEGREAPVDDAQYEEEFLLAAEVLAGAGYRHYEVSNFARPGAESRHNASYWSGEPYIGLGNGAHSYAHPLRRWNVRDWEDYAARLASGAGAEDGREELDEAASALERVWLGLRTDVGVDLGDAKDGARALVAGWARSGHAAVEGARVRLTPRGWLLLDRLAVDLDRELA
jgi:oxygen-independent coproporphyrinogen-3 oxidase